MDRHNHHATVVVIGRSGVIIIGPSGSGKTSLALALIDLWSSRGKFASLVTDDQVWLTARSGRLVGEAPNEIAGLVEIRGLGPVPIRSERATIIDLVVKLVPAVDVPRFREPQFESFEGISLPRMDLCAAQPERAARAVGAWLDGRL
jgi:HPr kinase/phosphorylase